MFKRVMNMLGMDSQSIANMLSPYGDANEIKNALDSGDTRALGFIPKLAEQIKQNNPKAYKYVANLYGVQG